MNYIGSHVSMSGKEMLVGSVKEALSYNANTFMVYTGAPQNTIRKPIEALNIEEAKKLMQENDIKNIVVHAPYIINLANTVKQETFDLGVRFLIEEIKRTKAIGAKMIVLHPGAHVGAGEQAGLDSIVKGLNLVIEQTDTVTIALETMAGKGTELGKTFEELKYIIDNVIDQDRLTICMDTCHIHDAGYDIVNDYEAIMQKFDEVIGLNKISVLHLNDSKNECGARKDRHANLDEGFVKLKTIQKFYNDPRFKDIPKILETPYIEKKAPYKEEIALLRQGSK